MKRGRVAIVSKEELAPLSRSLYQLHIEHPRDRISVSSFYPPRISFFRLFFIEEAGGSVVKKKVTFRFIDEIFEVVRRTSPTKDRYRIVYWTERERCLLVQFFFSLRRASDPMSPIVSRSRQGTLDHSPI